MGFIIFHLYDRFTGGVTHSFTGSAEDCIKLLSFDNMYIGKSHRSISLALFYQVTKRLVISKIYILFVRV